MCWGFPDKFARGIRSTQWNKSLGLGAVGSALWARMGKDGAIGFAVLKLAGKHIDLPCDVLKEDFPRVVLAVRADAPNCELSPGDRGALIEVKIGQSIARSGSVVSIADGMIAFSIEPSGNQVFGRGPRLTDCQLPAMYRPRSEDGHFGGWRGAIIIKHSPNQLHLQVEEGQVVPAEAELMFSPIGTDSGSQGRVYGEEGGVMNAADVRSRRIRVRAVTNDVLPSDSGTVTLVVDISRTLYRAA